MYEVTRRSICYTAANEPLAEAWRRDRHDAPRDQRPARPWTGLTPPFLPNQDFDVYQKDVAAGVRLDADVRKQLFWVEVDLDAPGLHLGERGF